MNAREWVLDRLPEAPLGWGHGFRDWLHCHTDGAFSRTFMTAKRVRYPVSKNRTEIAYECHCQHCDAQFVTASDGKLLKFWCDECGTLWAMDPDQPEAPPFTEDDDDPIGILGSEMEYALGDHIICPFCENDVELIHPECLSPSRTMQLLVITIETVGEYAGVFHWLARKTVAPDGERITIHPRYAYVISPRGALWKYAHVLGGGFVAQRQTLRWRICSDSTDMSDSVYHSWGAINNRRAGGWLYPHIPSLIGTTGEKTGLSMFWKTRNYQVVNYLKLWRHFKGVENLLACGMLPMVSELVDRDYLLFAYAPILDIDASKPHEILRMSKADFREICKRPYVWDCEMQRLYTDHRREVGAISAVEFLQMADRFGPSGLRSVRELASKWPDTTFSRLLSYLNKERLQPTEVQTLLDARKNAQVLAGDRPLTHEELWPRNLIATHDRLVDEVDQIRNPGKYLYKDADFRRIKDTLHPLEWTDGDLCIILPVSNADLVREGRKLRHCVGGYGDAHCRLEQTIFFVRHYRRPERSYYTLSMDLRGIPAQRQLHGYGNERHGPNKEYSHKIPRKVLDFVDAWKRAVLDPWYKNQIREVSA